MSISVRNLKYTYNPGTPFERRAVDDVSFDIGDGEFVGIIGHTGSGKSTLIQHLNALITPESGTVLVDGEDINTSSEKSRLRMRVGLVFQYPEYQLFEETVFKDVCFGPTNMGLDSESVKKNAAEALETVKLEKDLWDRSPFELSGGQKRRAALAGILAMKPEVLILDEPAAGLDPAGRRTILGIVESIHKAGTTVIMVSHSMDDVARLCTRVLVMDRGRLAYDGTCAEVFSHADELTKMGLSLPQSAILRNRLNQKGFALPDDIYTVNGLAEALAERLKKRKASC